MASDVIAWCFFELKDKSDVKMRDFEAMISKDDDISIQSNIFIYNKEQKWEPRLPICVT